MIKSKRLAIALLVSAAYVPTTHAQSATVQNDGPISSTPSLVRAASTVPAADPASSAPVTPGRVNLVQEVNMGCWPKFMTGLRSCWRTTQDVAFPVEATLASLASQLLRVSAEARGDANLARIADEMDAAQRALTAAMVKLKDPQSAGDVINALASGTAAGLDIAADATGNGQLSQIGGAVQNTAAVVAAGVGTLPIGGTPSQITKAVISTAASAAGTALNDASQITGNPSLSGIGSAVASTGGVLAGDVGKVIDTAASGAGSSAVTAAAVGAAADVASSALNQAAGITGNQGLAGVATEVSAVAAVINAANGATSV
jgi:hypothetical protein